MRAARITGYGYSEIIGSSRERSLSHIRWAIMMALRSRGLSTPLIGRLLGGRDHSTVRHGLERGAELVKTDPDFATLVSMVAAA
jgi:chromosomal replication initiation ATPase DnaA